MSLAFKLSLFPFTRLAHKVNLSYHLAVTLGIIVICDRKLLKTFTCHLKIAAMLVVYYLE